MKTYTVIIFLFITFLSTAQIEIVETNTLRLKGKINVEYVPGKAFSVSLKYNDKGEIKQYILEIEEFYKNEQINQSCRIEFEASEKEFRNLKNVIANDFQNVEDANTKVKLGQNTLTIKNGNYMRSIQSRLYNIEKNEDELIFSINNCGVSLTKAQWQQVFGY